MDYRKEHEQVFESNFQPELWYRDQMTGVEGRGVVLFHQQTAVEVPCES